MKVRVKYLMWLRDLVGVDGEEINLDRPMPVIELIDIIAKRHPKLKKHIDRVFSSDNPIIVLVNGTGAAPRRSLRDGDEVLFIPSVSGG